MEFGVLGPLTVTDRGRPVPIPAAKQRTLLACLLLRAGELVTVDELAEAIWGDALPAEPRRVIQTYVTRLRKLLRIDTLQSRPEGYLLAASPDQSDLGRFQVLVEQAREAAQAGDRAAEAAALRQALALWRGESLADVPSALLHRDAVVRLAEQRLEALQRRIEADLALGRHAELVAELRPLTDRYPLRERFWAQLMTALYRSGRQADALDAYTRARARLVDELGIDPGPELQQLHRAILTNDPTLDAPHSPAGTAARWLAVVPQQLPADIADLTGREKAVATLVDLLDGDGDPGRSAVVVAAIVGPAGIGKTALAVQAAHRVRSRFPDGQLYVNLRGAEAGPLDPHDVLLRFLTAMGVDSGVVPEDLDERAGLYRSQLADRRVLVVLDNAADAAQVRPLLPGSLGCAVVVASRAPLGVLPSRTLVLDVLTPGQAVELLAAIIGQDRVAAEPNAAAAIVEFCGGLPLALRIAGARLATKPHWRLARLAERLGDERRRLDELRVGDLEVRASFALSYQGRGDDERRLFRLLGLLQGPDFTAWAAAALLDARSPWPRTCWSAWWSPSSCRLPGTTWPARLATASTTCCAPLPGRTWRRNRSRNGGRRSNASWAPSLRSPGRHARRAGPSKPGRCHQVVPPGGSLTRPASAWRPACRRAGNRRGEAQILRSLGESYLHSDRYERAVPCYEQALTIFRDLGDQTGEAYALMGLGFTVYARGEFDRAAACFDRCLEHFEETDNRHGMAVTIRGVANLHRVAGRLDQAASCYRRSLDLFQKVGDRSWEGAALLTYGHAQQELGQLDEAAACCQRGLVIFQELADRRLQAEANRCLAELHLALGEPERAKAYLDRCIPIFRELLLRAEEARTLESLGSALALRGERATAQHAWRSAYAIYEELGMPEAVAVHARLT